MTYPARTRADLEAVLSAYLEAMERHNPSLLFLADGCRSTENGVPVPLGEALWDTVDTVAGYRVDYVDPEAGQVASHASFIENGVGGLLALRLKVVDGRIAEIETIVHRGAALALTMPDVEPHWQETEPEETRLDRQMLVIETENYLKAVSSGDGSLVKFSPGSALRLENGMLMAIGPNDIWPRPLRPIDDPDSWQAAVRSTLGMDPAAQLSTGIYAFITSYDNARFPIIDVERQVVFGIWNFRRRGAAQGVALDGKYYPFLPTMRFPNENLLGQAFKFRDGAITRVQGVFLNANVYRAGTGWDAVS